MRSFLTSLATVLAAGALLAALALVAWRQARTRELLAELAQVRTDRALTDAEMTEQSKRVQYLESRARVVPEARRRLRMRVPTSAEILIFSYEEP